MNHRFLALALAGTLTLGMLTACGGGNSDGNAETPNTVATPPVTESLTPAPESSAPVTEESPDALPESSAPVEESEAPSNEPSNTPAAKPTSTPKPTTPATPAPSTKPTPTPTPTPESKPQVSAVQSTWNDISKLSLPNLTAMDDATLSAMYGISASDLKEYVCMMPLMGVHATEFFIAEVKDGKMDTVKAGIAKRQADLDAQWAQYLPEQYELVQNYKLVTNGNYVLFAVSEYAGDAVDIFNSYTK